MDRDQQAAYLARVRAALPDLALERVAFNRDGLVNDVLVVDGQRVVRLPKDAHARQALAAEIRMVDLARRYVDLALPDFDLRRDDMVSYPSLPGEALLQDERRPVLVRRAHRPSTGPDAGRCALAGARKESIKSHRKVHKDRKEEQGKQRFEVVGAVSYRTLPCLAEDSPKHAKNAESLAGMGHPSPGMCQGWRRTLAPPLAICASLFRLRSLRSLRLLR